MSASDAFLFFYKVFAIGIFTAMWMIAAGVSLTVGVRTLWRRYAIGERQELAADDFLRNLEGKER